MKLKLFILFFVTIIILDFFSAKSIPRSLMQPSTTIIFLTILLVNISLLFRTIKPQVSDSFVLAINLMLISIFISMIPAKLYHDQSIFLTIRGSGNFYVFFLYFILFKMDFSQKEVLDLVAFLFFITLIIFIIDYATFPNTYFALRTEERRQAFTFIFKGHGFTLLGTFFFLAAFFRTTKLLYFIFYVLGFSFLNFFTGSRTMLIALLVGTLFILFYYRKTINKYFIYIVPVIVTTLAVGIYYLQSYISGLFLLTLEQSKTFHSNIRYHAFKFFTNEFQTNEITKILGNGYPVSGEYSEYMYRLKQHGLYLSDLGLIGFWTYFGILGVLAWLLIFKKIFFSKTNDQNVFIKAYFFLLLFTVLSGYPIFSPSYMISTVFCLFLFDKNKQENYV